MTGVLPVLTPMASKVELHSNENLLNATNATGLGSKLGSPQYCAEKTRDDIAACSAQPA